MMSCIGAFYTGSLSCEPAATSEMHFVELTVSRVFPVNYMPSLLDEGQAYIAQGSMTQSMVAVAQALGYAFGLSLFDILSID